MKRHTVILPFVLPRLTDKAAAQFLELLHAILAGIEHHYAEQVHRYHKQHREIRQNRQSPSSKRTDLPF
jgi:hypothetical protein